MRALREGFTTGACAAAATLGSCLWQRDGVCPQMVEIELPDGRLFRPEIIPLSFPSCGVIKDAGDDPDVTHGMMVVASADVSNEDGEVHFFGGEGVGRVTKPGLKIAVGEPAINPVPRQMIERAVRQVYPKRAADVTISIPNGADVAKRTFNPRLGIECGLSVLGTTGIVRPMSEDALAETIHLSLQVLRARGTAEVILTFGNQGEAAISELLPERAAEIVQMSNYVGFALDAALEVGFKRVLIAGHPGKLVKVSAGVMNTHSRIADVRFEPILAQLALMGAPMALMRSIDGCLTTTSAVPLIDSAGFSGVWLRLAQAAARKCRVRVRDALEIEVLFMGENGKVLGGTTGWNQ